MPFPFKSADTKSRIRTVEVGTGPRAILLGGESVFPFYTFDGEIINAPKVGIEITDLGMDAEPECVQRCYEGCHDTVEMAEMAAASEGVDFLSLRLAGGDPNGKNRSAAELSQFVRDVSRAVPLPLMISGCGNVGKDTEILGACASVLQGRNAVFLSAVEENYREVGSAVALSAGQIVGAESAVDINLAKQLNILLIQLGADPEKIVMNPGTAAAGYGFDYVISTLDRVKAAALSQDDATLQMPIITSVASEAWSVKESTASEEEMPLWGDLERRGIEMEVMTASAVLSCGSDAVIVKHPASARTIHLLIDALLA